jgi:hypothetical protein
LAGTASKNACQAACRMTREELLERLVILSGLHLA